MAGFVVTANDLLVGDVIYLTPAQGWTRRLREAAVAPDAAAGEELLTEARRQPARAVGPYLIEVAAAADGPRPTVLRERVRARGPSNRPEHGRRPEDL